MADQQPASENQGGSPQQSPAPSPSPSPPAGRTYTEQEVAELIRQTVAAAQQHLQPQSQPQQPPQPESVSGRDDDIVTLGDAKRLMDQNFQARVQPLMQMGQFLYNQNVSLMERFSRQRHADAWQKYDGELRQEIQKRQQYKIVTDDDFEEAIAIVKGRHLDEFAAERAKTLYSGAPVTETGGVGSTGGVAAAGDWWNNAPDDLKGLWHEYSMTPQLIRESCEKRGITPERYVEMWKQGNIIRVGRELVSTNIGSEKK